MKKIYFLLLITIFFFQANLNLAQNIAITDDDNYIAEPSAMLDVFSESKGMLAPRLTTTQREAINLPATGLLVFDTTINNFYFFDGSSWKNISAEGVWLINSNKLYTSDLNYRLGIGSNSPNSKLEVKADASFGVNDTLFVVKDKNGNPVFAVFPDGAKVFVNQAIKGSVGGFAVSGRSPSKALETSYLYVTPDSTRITFEDVSYKGSVGGFAVSGRSPSKAGASTTSLINLFPDNYFIGDSAGISTSGLYNNFIGYKAGAKNTTGQKNTFMGYYAGYNNIGGWENLFLGLESGKKNTSGYANLFIGNRSGFTNVGGHNNSFIGVNSGYSNSSGYYNVFIGDGSGYSNNTGWENVYIGLNAGANGTGNIVGNVFMGSFAGSDNTSSGYNTYIGHHSGWNNLGAGNTFLGYASGEGSNGSYNSYIGRMAGVLNVGNYNTMIGNLSARYCKSGSNNTFLGNSSGQNLKSASSSVLIGHFAGSSKPDSVSTGNVFIGYMAGYDAYGNNQLYIENSSADSTSALIWGDFLNNKLALNANVGIGTTAPDKKLHVVGDARITGDIYYGSSPSATVYAKPDFVFYNDYEKDLTISEIEKFVNDKKHLPWLTSASDEKDGINLTRMQFETLEAVENLQLQLIDLNKENQNLKQSIEIQQNQIQNLISEIEKLKSK